MWKTWTEGNDGARMTNEASNETTAKHIEAQIQIESQIQKKNILKNKYGKHEKGRMMDRGRQMSQKMNIH